MEKPSNDFVNLSNLPPEIQQHIAAYLDAPALSFFAKSNKQTLKNVLLLLRHYQAWFPLRLTAGMSSTYLYQASQLLVCGDNRYGQLGLGDKAHRSSFSVVPWPENRGNIRQIIAGGNHTVVLTQANQLWVCGDNKYGQLGLGDRKHRSLFTAVPWPAERGRIQQVITGNYHTLVLTDGNRLWVCGDNDAGQLGLGDTENRSTFTAVSWPAERGRIEQVVASAYHTVVLTQANQLWVCGSNRFGQLELGDNIRQTTNFTAVPWPEERGRIQQVIAGNYHTLVFTDDNRLWGCGDNAYGQLGLGDKANRASFTTVPWPKERGTIEQVIAGGYYTVVLTDDNKLWVCGKNKYGKRGLGDNDNPSIFTAVPWPGERGKIQQVNTAGNQTIVLTEDNQLWVCGANSYGQLGLGDNEHRSTFMSVKAFPEAMQQVLTLNHTLNQLIKIGTSLTLTPDTETSTLLSQHQRDEPEDQPPLKKLRL